MNNDKWESYLELNPALGFMHSLGPREIFRDISDGHVSVKDVANLMGWSEEDTRKYYDQWKLHT